MQYDFNYFNKLIGNASFLYWRMHINSKGCIGNVFQYYDIVMNFYNKLVIDEGQNKMEIILNLIELISVEE